MSAKTLSTLAILLLALLPGCSLVDQIRYTAAEYAGRLVVIECSLALTQRAANLSAINGWLATANHTPRATAFDCDGDGAPDF